MTVIAGYVLIQTEVGMEAVAAVAVRAPGVLAAASVAGPYDVIVRAQARSIDLPGRLVVSRSKMVGGVLHTITCPIISKAEAGPGGQ